jgi:hypothetical protein
MKIRKYTENKKRKKKKKFSKKEERKERIIHTLDLGQGDVNVVPKITDPSSQKRRWANVQRK